MQQNTEVE